MLLEPLGPSHELAMAYSTRAQLHILAEERRLAPKWGDRAVAMAEALGDPEALVHALTNAACLEPGSFRETQVRAALERALSTGELQRVAPVAAARAEAAWARGDPEGARVEAMRAYSMAMAVGSHWDIGRIALWLRRVGALGDVPADLPRPFLMELEGRWREAADAWERMGCPYEQALALSEGDEEAQRAALRILEGLGAAPSAAVVRSRLLKRGVRGLARGPRPSTRANPGRLTNRQVEVLELLAEGLSNREIGRRLFLSTRTVDHHVSALLHKLGAGSRARAAALARDMTRRS